MECRQSSSPFVNIKDIYDQARTQDRGHRAKDASKEPCHYESVVIAGARHLGRPNTATQRSKQTPPYHSAPAEDVGEGNSEERSERDTCDSRRYLAETLLSVITWRLMCRYVRSKIAQPAICGKPWIGPRNQADSQGTKRCQRTLPGIVSRGLCFSLLVTSSARVASANQ